MRFGLFGINFGPCADPERAARGARGRAGRARVAVDGRARRAARPAGAAVAVAARGAVPRSGGRRSPGSRPPPRPSASAPASSSCRSGTRSCSRRSSRASTSSPKGRLIFGHRRRLPEARVRRARHAVRPQERRARSTSSSAILALWTQPKPAYEGRVRALRRRAGVPAPGADGRIRRSSWAVTRPRRSAAPSAMRTAGTASRSIPPRPRMPRRPAAPPSAQHGRPASSGRSRSASRRRRRSTPTTVRRYADARRPPPDLLPADGDRGRHARGGRRRGGAAEPVGTLGRLTAKAGRGY